MLSLVDEVAERLRNKRSSCAESGVPMRISSKTPEKNGSACLNLSRRSTCSN